MSNTAALVIPREHRLRGAHGRSAHQPTVRLVQSRANGTCVVEVTAPRTWNVPMLVYRALAPLGLRLQHTELAVREDRVVQRVHLREPDDTPLLPPRLLRALRALSAAFAS